MNRFLARCCLRSRSASYRPTGADPEPRPARWRHSAYGFAAGLLVVIASLTDIARADGDVLMQRLAELTANEPSLADVRQAALRSAGLDREPSSSLSRRARWAGLLPQLSLKLALDRADDADLSRASSGTERLDFGQDRDLGIELRALWKLDRIVYDSDELRAAQLAQNRNRERSQLLAHVTTLYYQRRKLQLMPTPAQPSERISRILAIAELTAKLDAFTGGEFSRALPPPHL